jgi:hypothetical protein
LPETAIEQNHCYTSYIMELKSLLESASKDVKTLNELKNLAVKLQQYKLGAECRRIEKELYPITDEEKIATERIKEIDLVLRMVEVGFNGKKVYYKIDKALELFKKKKGKFDLKDAAKIISDANRLFNREVSE